MAQTTRKRPGSKNSSVDKEPKIDKSSLVCLVSAQNPELVLLQKPLKSDTAYIGSLSVLEKSETETGQTILKLQCAVPSSVGDLAIFNYLTDDRFDYRKNHHFGVGVFGVHNVKTLSLTEVLELLRALLKLAEDDRLQCFARLDQKLLYFALGKTLFRKLNTFHKSDIVQHFTNEQEYYWFRLRYITLANLHFPRQFRKMICTSRLCADQYNHFLSVVRDLPWNWFFNHQRAFLIELCKDILITSHVFTDTLLYSLSSKRFRVHPFKECLILPKCIQKLLRSLNGICDGDFAKCPEVRLLIWHRSLQIVNKADYLSESALLYAKLWTLVSLHNVGLDHPGLVKFFPACGKHSLRFLGSSTTQLYCETKSTDFMLSLCKADPGFALQLQRAEKWLNKEMQLLFSQYLWLQPVEQLSTEFHNVSDTWESNDKFLEFLSNVVSALQKNKFQMHKHQTSAWMLLLVALLNNSKTFHPVLMMLPKE